jgi:hypothetical protein
MDVFNAGLGTDSILINASNITALEQTGAGNRHLGQPDRHLQSNHPNHRH